MATMPAGFVDVAAEVVPCTAKCVVESTDTCYYYGEYFCTGVIDAPLTTFPKGTLSLERVEPVCVPVEYTHKESVTFIHRHEVVVPRFEYVNSVDRCCGEHEGPCEKTGDFATCFDHGGGEHIE